MTTTRDTVEKAMNNSHPFQVNMGDVALSYSKPLEASISTCVSVCMYHKDAKLGGMTHIAKAIKSTPRKEYYRRDSLFYGKHAVETLYETIKSETGTIRKESLSLFIAGGLHNEEPVVETLEALGLVIVQNHVIRKKDTPEPFPFTLRGADINENMYRNIYFDPQKGSLTITKHPPFDTRYEQKRIIHF